MLHQARTARFRVEVPHQISNPSLRFTRGRRVVPVFGAVSSRAQYRENAENLLLFLLLRLRECWIRNDRRDQKKSEQQALVS